MKGRCWFFPCDQPVVAIAGADTVPDMAEPVCNEHARRWRQDSGVHYTVPKQGGAR